MVAHAGGGCVCMSRVVFALDVDHVLRCFQLVGVLVFFHVCLISVRFWWLSGLLCFVFTVVCFAVGSLFLNGLTTDY